MNNISFEKNGHIIYHSCCQDEDLIKTANGYCMSENLYIDINESIYLMNGLRIHDCSQASLYIDDKEKYYCYGARLREDTLVFEKQEAK